MIEVGDGRGRRSQGSAGNLSRQRDAPARRLGFVAVEVVGRAVRQAQAAHDALVGQGLYRAV